MPRENGVRRLSGEPLAIVPKKALERLSTKCVMEFFKNKPLASAEASAMERGVYTVTEADLVLINSQGSEDFWQSIIPDKTIRERTLNMWKLAGMDSDARRFSTGKQILIATERALSDALHKHSAEMRDVYPFCRQAGVSSQDADKFMAMLYLCHDFYKGLANVYINTAMLAHFGAPAARRLWDTIKTEGLKKDGIGKIKSSLETETEKLNREVKEAIANGTAKVREIDLKLLDERDTTAKFDWGKKRIFGIAALMRGDYQGPAPAPEISRANQENLKYGYYVLSEEEKKILKGNNGDLEFIWDKIKGGNFDLTFNTPARQYAGFNKNQQHPLEIDRILVVSSIAWNKIQIQGLTITDKAQNIIKSLGLYANFYGGINHLNGENIQITSKIRNPMEQAKIHFYRGIVDIAFNRSPQYELGRKTLIQHFPPKHPFIKTLKNKILKENLNWRDHRANCYSIAKEFIISYQSIIESISKEIAEFKRNPATALSGLYHVAPIIPMPYLEAIDPKNQYGNVEIADPSYKDSVFDIAAPQNSSLAGNNFKKAIDRFKETGTLAPQTLKQGSKFEPNAHHIVLP